jgi:hypothetical protein
MKPNHLPVFWRDAPVKPFRYNPKAEEQEDMPFVQIRAKFLPSKDVFAFESLLAPPTDPPKYLKLSKKDKQAAQQEKNKEKNQEPEQQETLETEQQNNPEQE